MYDSTTHLHLCCCSTYCYLFLCHLLAQCYILCYFVRPSPVFPKGCSAAVINHTAVMNKWHGHTEIALTQSKRHLLHHCVQSQVFLEGCSRALAMLTVGLLASLFPQLQHLKDVCGLGKFGLLPAAAVPWPPPIFGRFLALRSPCSTTRTL